MIEIRELTKHFGDFCALDNVNMTVQAGTVYGLVGPNGAGKSTLIRHLTGVYRPDSGSITVSGMPVFDCPEVQERMLCIYDQIYYYMQASTRDMKRLYQGLYPSFDTARYEKLRDAFPEVEEKVPLRNLSKGQRKQSAFWLALSCRPEVLVLDEPVDGLDPVARRQVWSLLMGDVAEAGTTVLLSSHNLRELEDVCDHVGVLHHGNILLERSLTELQGNVSKVQIIVGAEEPELPAQLEVLHHSRAGKMHTYILRGQAEDVLAQLRMLAPDYLESLPLSLEEIFIYELGGVDYAVQDILL